MWESERVAGPWAGRAKSDIRNCTWTKAQMVNHLGARLGGGFSEASLDRLIERMIKERHLLRIEKPEPRFEVEDGELTKYPREGEVYISRMAEIVRTTGAIHDFPSRSLTIGSQIKYHPQLIEGTKWAPRIRKSSPREIDTNELVDKIRSAFDATPNYNLPNGSSLGAAITDLKLVLKSINQEFGGNLKFSKFQFDTIYAAILNSWSNNPPKKAIVITADTGAGKTLGFVIPAMADALIENRMAEENEEGVGISQLLLYPRNDLAKDQKANLDDLLSRLNDNLIDAGRLAHIITIAIDAGGLIQLPELYVPSNKPLVQREIWDACKEIEGGGKKWRRNVYDSCRQKYAGSGGNITRPANIMIAGIESFRRRLANEHVVAALRKNLRRVVLDEIHLSSGIEGAHHSFMMRRLRQICYFGSNRLTFMGASATISRPREHGAKIWRFKPNQIEHINSSDDSEQNLVPTGIMNHILVRTKKGAATGGALSDLTSLIGHQRRTREIHDRPSRYDKLQKSIGFADSHDVVGNWFQLSRENEMTTRNDAITNATTHNQMYPYSHWYSRPLEIHNGGAEVCNSCQKMEKASNPIMISNDAAIRIKRLPNETLATAERFDMQTFLEQGNGGQIEVSGLDSCPYLQAGTCWWFAPRTAETPTDLLEDRPGLLTGTNFSYKDVLRVKKHTSKSNNSEGDYTTSADHTFGEIPIFGAYPGGWSDDGLGSKIKHDVVVATPTLEVGIDMSNVTEVFTHKAIRNISTYRQKIGRGGREEGTDTIAATLMSPRTTDFLHYRSPGKLIDYSLREPVPVASENREIMRSEAYMSVFDWLAVERYKIEKVVKAAPGNPEWGGWGNAINTAVNALRDRRNEVLNHINYSTDTRLDEEDLLNAIEIASAHLRELLNEYPCSEDPAMRIADYISWRNHVKSGPGKGPETVKNLVDPILVNLERRLISALTSISDVETAEPGYATNFDIIAIMLNLCRNKSVKEIIDSLDELEQVISIAKQFCEDDPGDLEKESVMIDIISCLRVVNQLIIQASGETHHKLISQIKALRAPLDTTYLTGILTACRQFQEDCPYVMIGTLFENPYENRPELLKDGFGNNPPMRDPSPPTVKEALRYYLPGMWTFRAFRGQPLRVKSGYLQGGSPPEWVEHYGSTPNTSPMVEEIGQMADSELKSIPISLRANLDEEAHKTMKLVLKEIYLEAETGISGSLQKVRMDDDGLVVDFDVPSPGGFLPASMRPKAYSTTWDIIANVGDLDGVTSHEIRGIEEGLSNFPVLRHPLIGGLFSEVNWSEFKVRRVATCVSRNNGNRIRFKHNGQPAVYINDFETEGIQFTISSRILEKSKSLTDSWRELPFDTMALRAFRVVLERNAGIEWNQRYALDSYIDCIVQLAYITDAGDDCPENKFPKTFGEFIDLVLVTPMPNHIIQERANFGIGGKQMEGMQDDLSDIRMLVSQNISTIKQSIDETVKQWTRETFCNTLAILIMDAAAAYSGVPSDSISYSFNVDSDNQWKIYLYDEDANGNGAMSVIREYFQIPIEVRDANEHFSLGSLPTTDFVSELERRLMICSEHVAQSIAIEGLQGSPIVPEELKRQAGQLKDDYKKNSWDICDASNVREAALHNLRRYFILQAGQEDIYTLDFHRQALELCDSGCPACNGDEMQNAFRGPLNEQYTCRSLVDMLVSLGPEIGGYLLKNSDEEELGALAGKPIEPELILEFKPIDGGSGLAKRLVHWWDTPPIGLHWTREGGNVDPDWLVRHREAI